MTIDLVAELESLRPLADQGLLTAGEYIRPSFGTPCACPISMIGLKHQAIDEDEVWAAQDESDEFFIQQMSDFLGLDEGHLNALMCVYDDAVEATITPEMRDGGDIERDYRAGLEAMIAKARELAS